MSLRVTSAGLLTTVQDLGRPGFQRDGVSPGGAMDVFALRAGNLLVGNGDGDAALEITLSGPAIAFEADALVALTGSNLGARVGDRALTRWRAVLVHRGATLCFEGDGAGCRAYLAVAGGIDVPVVLGSRSTFLRARLGGHEGRGLLKGDVLAVGAPSALAQRVASRLATTDSSAMIARWGIGQSIRPAYSRAPIVRVMAGEHAPQLSNESHTHLWADSFRLSASSDRQGLRLEGPRLELSNRRELLSEAVAFGTIQLPPDGNPIVLMADRQTTGGYPRIGEVASVDLPLLAQLRPGDAVRFRQISLAEAQALYVAREHDIRQARREIELRHA